MPSYTRVLERTSTGVIPASPVEEGEYLIVHGLSFSNTGASVADALVEGRLPGTTTWENIQEFSNFGTVDFARPVGPYDQIRITFGGAAGRVIVRYAGD